MTRRVPGPMVDAKPKQRRALASAATSDTIECWVTLTKKFASAVDELEFSPPVTHVYNPLKYAWRSHERFIRLCRPQTVRVLFLGMNPGPWGMAQTGVPFGEVAAARDWLGINELVEQPPVVHPKRPIEGFACRRSEVSGQRLWGLFKQRYASPAEFFALHTVVNYCPLVFMEASARNRTPDKLPAAESRALHTICDHYLQQVLLLLQPTYLVGIGAYAEQCLRRVVDETPALVERSPKVLRILHPSPASPAANRDWSGVATKQLIEGGVWES